MIPRGAPDIGWRDLGAGFCIACNAMMLPRPKHGWKHNGPPTTNHALACLSVRSGFDALLPILAFPPEVKS